MKVLIRDRSTRLFLADHGTWVTNTGSAHDFESCVEAVNHLGRQHLKGVDLWFAFPISRYDFRLPLTA
jgi:hypothetical protein